MTDGLGTGFSSKLVLDENDNGLYNITDKSATQVDSIMLQFMGIHRYIKMDNLPYDIIHHIDMHMKLLDEQTLLVGQYPDSVNADRQQIEANLQYILQHYLTPFGTPYKVVRIPMPPDELGRYPDQNGYYRTYTNAVFVNKTLLVPTYDVQYDSTALRILQDALPGYKIVGIGCQCIDPFQWGYPLYSKAIGTSDPMLIVHQPLEDGQAANQPYPYPLESNIALESRLLLSFIAPTHATLPE